MRHIGQNYVVWQTTIWFWFFFELCWIQICRTEKYPNITVLFLIHIGLCISFIFNAFHFQLFQNNLFDMCESMVSFYKNLSYFESKNQSEEAGNFIVWWSKSIYMGAEGFHHSADSECRLMSLLYQQILEKWPFFMNKQTNLINKCHLNK